MLSINQRLPSGEKYDDRLILPFERRQKSRMRVSLESGEEAALILERGMVMRGGDLLLANDGRVVQIVAADESVLHVVADNHRQLARAAYHLGNRHVPLQVGEGWLRLEQDHVLKEMLLGLGMQVVEQSSPFEPEAGAYGGAHHHQTGDALLVRPIPRVKRHA